MSQTFAPPSLNRAGGKSPAVAARELLASHWNGVLPVRPEELARKVGLTIRNKSSVFTDEDYPYSGHFLRNEGVIEVNIDEGVLRQRFTLAHELGHFALGHQDSPRDMSANFSSAQSTPIERAANQFAAELLMPAEAVSKVVRSGMFKSIDELAEAFQVSKVAMTYRVNNLGLLV